MKWLYVPVAFLIGLAILLLAFAARDARAHLHGCEGDCQTWMWGLQNGNGTVCCDFNEATNLNDPDWDTTMVKGKPHYRVRLKGEWLDVEDASVVPSPNRLGPALAWIVHLNGKPWVKCFLPGAFT